MHRNSTDIETLLARVRRDLQLLAARIERWEVDREGFDSFRTGFKKTYRRARKAMQRARRSGADDDFHDWRKRVKYHWYHARLLRDIWKPVMAVRADQLDELGDLLGDHHDLAVLRRTIEQDPGLVANDREGLTRVVTLIGQRQRRIENDCLRLGRLLCAEKPGALTRRVAAYWHVQSSG